MTVDCHAYCFTAPDTPAGHASAQAHLDLWQRQYALHHQPAFRTRDRAPANSADLLDPIPGDPHRLHRGRNFRVDPVGRRLIWTVNGEDITKQQLPPNVLEFGPGALVAEMDHAGVDWAMLHADATLTRDTAYLAQCVAAFPSRLQAMAPLDEWLIASAPDRAIAQAESAIRDHRLHALKIIPAYAYQHGELDACDSEKWRPFWQAVAALDVPIFFTLGSRPGIADPRQGFVDELWSVRRLVERFPTLRCAITHGYPWRAYLSGDRLAVPASHWEPLRNAGIFLEVGFPYRIGDVIDYPYESCWPVLDAMIEHVAARQLTWGSDMPFQNRFCTYRQSLSYLERYARARVGPAVLADLLGDNAARLLRLPTHP